MLSGQQCTQTGETGQGRDWETETARRWGPWAWMVALAVEPHHLELLPVEMLTCPTLVRSVAVTPKLPCA